MQLHNKMSPSGLLLISNIVNWSFFNKECIYYYGNDKFIQQSLYFAETPILTYKTSYAKLCTPTGYILAFENINEVKNLLAHIFNFVPHNRVLIFCHYYACEGLNIVQKSKQHALDVIMVDLIQHNSSTSIVIYRDGKAIDVNEKAFEPKVWVPYFADETVKVAVFDYRPFIFISDDGIVGYEKYILDEVMEGWPIEYVVLPKFSWTIAANAVRDYKYNISAAGFWWDDGFGTPVDKTYPHSEIISTMLVPKPDFLPHETFPLQAMTGFIWCLILSTTLIVAIMEYILSTYHRTQHHSLVRYVLNNLSKLVGNSAQIHHSWYLLKAYSILWSVIAVLLITTYSAGFSAINTVPKHTKPINNFADIASSEITCYESSVVTSSVFLRSNNKDFSKILPKMVSYFKDVLPNKACTPAEILGKNYVVTEIELGIYGREHLRVINDYYKKSQMSIYLNRNSPYTKIFNEKTKRFSEHGFFDVWLRFTQLLYYAALKRMSNFFTMNAKENSGAAAMTLVKLQGAFYLLLIGFAISSIVLICEMHYFRYQEKASLRF